MVAPIWVDYGKHLKLGKNVFVNRNSYFMDGNYITIGDNVFIGPNCGLYTNTHPENIESRNEELDKALPTTIEKNIRLGANISGMPRVMVGRGADLRAGRGGAGGR